MSGRQELEDVVVKAAELFQEHGYEATTVNQILRAVELSKGGLYHRVSSKAELLYRGLRLALDNLRSNVMVPVSRIEDPEQQLRVLTWLHIESILTCRGMFAVPSAEADALDGRKRQEIRRLERRYVEFVRGVFERLREADRLPGVDPAVATFNHLGMILHVVRWYRAGGRLSPHEIADQITDTTLSGAGRVCRTLEA